LPFFRAPGFRLANRHLPVDFLDFRDLEVGQSLDGKQLALCPQHVVPEFSERR